MSSILLPQILSGQLRHYFPEKPIKLYDVPTVLSVAGITEWVKILYLLSTLVPVQWYNLKIFQGSPHWWLDNAAIVQTFLTGNCLQGTKILPSKKTSLLV